MPGFADGAGAQHIGGACQLTHDVQDQLIGEKCEVVRCDSGGLLRALGASGPHRSSRARFPWRGMLACRHGSAIFKPLLIDFFTAVSSLTLYTYEYCTFMSFLRLLSLRRTQDGMNSSVQSSRF